MRIYEADCKRYEGGGNEPPKFQKYFRLLQEKPCYAKYILYKILYKHYRLKNMIEISENTNIGKGLYFAHAFSITINPQAIIGENVNLHKGVTIGQENRGKRKGCPTIGNCVWIGVNSTIVGKITIGDDVLIAPNTYVNCDIPSHSVVFGNPCIIKHMENATEDYINHKV